MRYIQKRNNGAAPRPIQIHSAINDFPLVIRRSRANAGIIRRYTEGFVTTASAIKIPAAIFFSREYRKYRASIKKRNPGTSPVAVRPFA